MTLTKSCIAAVLAVAATASTLAFANSNIEENPNRNVYYGELHMHTAYSLDAYLGGTRLTPYDSYRHAKGETVVVNGKPHKMRRPLDFAAVTDHAEYLGEMYAALNPDSPAHQDPAIQELIGLTDPAERRKWFMRVVQKINRGESPAHTDFYPGEEVVKSGWQVQVDAAKQHNQPGVFTTFPAFEWSGAPKGGNLHRNVIFRNDDVLPDVPMGYADINREDGLWQWLKTWEAKGSRAMALPHNSNASKGNMFPETNAAGEPIDKEYADLRGHFERAIEMIQIKGNSEVHRQFWAADEFADFENADSMAAYSGRVALKQNYVRYGVGRGLGWQQQLGSNPFKLGFVGGTDNHNGLMGDTDEDNFVGGHGMEDDSPAQRQTGVTAGWIAARDQTPGGITGVWASSNTRHALWDAIHARETFATSGPRMAVRFFAGWKFPDNLADKADAIERAYDIGVPMGGDLTGGKKNQAPRFLVMAAKDALGANLDRAQIIKAWVDSEGEQQDKVFDVAWAGERIRNSEGKLPPVGNTVDLKTATYRNTIGAAQLSAVWQDPEFNPQQQAVYYLRVLEIPTPRWTTFDAVNADLPLLDDVAATIQERAWSSPIWYQP